MKTLSLVLYHASGKRSWENLVTSFSHPFTASHALSLPQSHCWTVYRRIITTDVISGHFLQRWYHTPVSIHFMVLPCVENSRLFLFHRRPQSKHHQVICKLQSVRGPPCYLFTLGSWDIARSCSPGVTACRIPLVVLKVLHWTTPIAYRSAALLEWKLSSK